MSGVDSQYFLIAWWAKSTDNRYGRCCCGGVWGVPSEFWRLVASSAAGWLRQLIRSVELRRGGSAVAVQVWIGEKPEHPNERRAIVALANGLERLDGLYLLLANFSVGGRAIDLVLIKQDAIFIVELKHCDGKIFGDVNGPWFIESANGERKRLNPGRKNPYNQVISYYYSLINFLNEHRTAILSSQKAVSIDFRTCKRLVVIAPTIQAGSQVETDWKVELKGLDELPTYLVTERSSEISLSEEEMLAIPQILHCTRWSEINELLAGVMPRWESTIGAVGEVGERQVEVGGAVPTAVAPVSSLWVQVGRLFSTWTGRAAVVLGVLVLVLAGTLMLRPSGVMPVPDQARSFLLSTSGPAGGGGIGENVLAQSCVWSGFQAVGRRQGREPGSWENVGVLGTAPALAPDVVVTLQEVSFCDGRITMTWSVRNSLGDEDVVLPLTSENIAVRDSLGNEYVIDDSRSRPSVIRVAPGSRSQGSAVIMRAASLNASTLRIMLRQLPFGETTWLVPMSARAR